MAVVFSMFLASPPTGTPVASVYRQKRAFGPAPGNEAGFSPNLVMEIAESAAAEFRTVRTCCTGQVRIVGVQAGSSTNDPNAPLVLVLEPLAAAIELRKLGEQTFFEPPLAFIYTGLDPNSLRTHLMPVINDTPYFNPGGGVLTPDERWERFRRGRPLEIKASGFRLAEVSAANLSNGFHAFSFAARTNWMRVPDASTPPLNFLDPVTLFQQLVNKELIAQGEARNSWLEVVTKDRVIITVRNEWNSPLADRDVSVTDGTTQHIITLTPDREGTFAGPAGMSSYVISIPERKLTRIAGSFNRAENNSEFTNAMPAHHVVSSVRPEDWFHGPDSSIDPTKTLPLFTEHNTVRTLVDGLETFRWMVSDINKIKSPSHFFLFTSWWITHTFELIPGQPATTLKSLLENINEIGVPIRSMIWHFWAGTRDPHGDLGINRAAHNFISGLRFARSLFDSRTHHAFILLPFVILEDPSEIGGPMGAAAELAEQAEAEGLKDRAYHPGCHHSKTYVIRGTEGTIAYIGGIDFNPDRLDGPEHLINKPFHDVHSRIAGPAAIDLASAFVFRWNDHPENKGIDRRITVAPPSACPAGETCIDPVPAIPGHDATCMVQIARTFGATTQDYAPSGDRNIWATLMQALEKAKKYVYFEEQYMVSPELRDLLVRVLPRIDHLVVVIDHYGEQSLIARFQFEAARLRFFKPLRDLLGDQFDQKVHVFSLVKNGSPYKVHSKLVIIDDVFATLGSANMNRRGFTHDTETNAFILDGRVVGGVRRFARDLRVRLWGEHLGWVPHGDTSKLWNIDKAIDILLNHRPPTSRLAPYDFSRGVGVEQAPRWDRIIDPEGSDPPGPPPAN
jgi:phosphatidylserine/phosphatidylglycerophosphate/cardiolipin synthase-like enzyme